MELAKKKKKSMKEQPFKPEVDTGIEKPVRGMLAVGDVNDKYSTYPSNGLTPRRLARIFRAADGGAGLSTLFQTNFFRLFFRYCTGV